MLTENELLTIMPQAGSRARVFLDPLNDAMHEFGIETPVREAAFIAQIAHESGQLRYTEEIASGRAYEGRVDLGNTVPGDGPKFKGRGLLQITGRDNYTRVSQALFNDADLLILNPGELANPVAACRSAGWFWSTRRLNLLADAGDFVAITRRINGGVNGMTDRIRYWDRARAVLGVPI